MDKVIFACVHNAGRSQMAAAFFNALADPQRASAVSAGTAPADRIHPRVIDVMREVGLDLSAAHPRLLTTTLASDASLLITMGCGDACPHLPGLARDDWPLPDPTNRLIDEVRAIRDEIRVRVARVVAARGWQRRRDAREPKQAIAHRGASAYAPEHTLAAYRLALQQGADYVEQDLAVTRDGVLICLHDDTLERTTDVEKVFPDRASVDPVSGRRRWLAVDFTLGEIKQLDAGGWFDTRYAGERIPTWQDAVDTVGTAAGLYPELKSPHLYQARGVDMVRLFVDSYSSLGLSARPAGSLIIQSFDEDTLRRLAVDLPHVPRVLLITEPDGPRWLSPGGLADVATFATGVGPHKALLKGRPELVRSAHAAGLTVTPYTFTSRGPLALLRGLFSNLQEEMRYFLYDLDVDALFTDNPDRFPKTHDSRS